ncbi:MAG: arylamine N-acetyltransferase family protein, partial [Geminicoccaceae bacterium]
MLDLDGYLERMGLRGEALPPTRTTISRLQEAHLLSIPFENLDVVWKRHIQLDEQLLFNKIIGERRGGFCYELNGLMVAILKQFGFEAHLMSAAVANEEGIYGLDAAHACIRVVLEQPMLMDVGFGRCFMRPLQLKADQVQHDGRDDYRLKRQGDLWRLQCRSDDPEVWQDYYRLTEKPWSLSDFQDMCNYQQTSPKSYFAGRTICSIATETGRTTLTADRLILTEDDHREETPFSDQVTFGKHLREIFGIVRP